MLVAVDMGTGEPVALGYVNGYDLHTVQPWLEGLMQRLGVGVIVTDDLSAYRIFAQRLQLVYQVCQFHVRRWVGKAIRGFRETIPKEWQWVLDEVEQLIEVLPPEGDKRLYALWKQVAVRRSGRAKLLTALEQLRDLLLRLSERWQDYCTFQARARSSLDKQFDRASHRTDENTRPYRAWLQDLAEHVNWPDVGRYSQPIIAQIK